MTRTLAALLLAACAPPPADTQPVPQLAPPGATQLTLSGPPFAFERDTIELVIAPNAADGTLVDGDRVSLGWGALNQAGRCPHAPQTGGRLCLQIDNPTRSALHLFTTTATGDAATAEMRRSVRVPVTPLDRVFLQGMSVRGTSSSTTNVLSIDILDDPCETDNGGCDDLCGVEVTQAGSDYTASALCDCSVGELAPDGMACVSCDPAGLPYGGGSGTELDPYLICDAAQLDSLGSTAGYARLTQDLDFSGGGTIPSGINIAAGTHLDGDGHRLIDPPLTEGLFLIIPVDGSVRDLHLELSGTPTIGGSFGGVLASFLLGTVEDVTLTGDATFTGNTAGGLIGSSGPDAEIRDVHVTGTYVKTAGTGPLGGITGNAGGVIANTTFTGAVSGMGNVGGIAGFSDATTMFRVRADVDATGFSTGGLIGRAQRTTVDRSLADGSVRSQVFGFPGTRNAPISAGGLVGLVTTTSNPSDRSLVRQSVARVDVFNEGPYGGGLVGFLGGTVEDSYTRDGSVTRTAPGGGDCQTQGGTGGAVGGADGNALLTRVVVMGTGVSSPDAGDGVAFVADETLSCGTVRPPADGYYAFDDGTTDPFGDAVEVSAAPADPASYPTLDLFTVWTIPLTDPAQTAPFMPVMRWQCGSEGITCTLLL